MTALVRITDLLMQARHLQIMDIYAAENATENQVRVLEILTEILERNLKLSPDDHIGKKILLMTEEFDQYEAATITFQEIGRESFLVYVDSLGEEYANISRDQFKFVGGD